MSPPRSLRRAGSRQVSCGVAWSPARRISADNRIGIVCSKSIFIHHLGLTSSWTCWGDEAGPPQTWIQQPSSCRPVSAAVADLPQLIRQASAPDRMRAARSDSSGEKTKSAKSASDDSRQAPRDESRQVTLRSGWWVTIKSPAFRSMAWSPRMPCEGLQCLAVSCCTDHSVAVHKPPAG